MLECSTITDGTILSHYYITTFISKLVLRLYKSWQLLLILKHQWLLVVWIKFCEGARYSILSYINWIHNCRLTNMITHAYNEIINVVFIAISVIEVSEWMDSFCYMSCIINYDIMWIHFSKKKWL